jgi:CubicO group peptidase (beta-lactamase class C family)
VTIADMYAHRSGLREHAGDQLEDLGYSRAQVLARLRLEKLHSFRDVYAYTNFGMTAAGEAVARAARTDWASLSQRDIYGPLDMTSTSSRFADYTVQPRGPTGSSTGSTSPTPCASPTPSRPPRA